MRTALTVAFYALTLTACGVERHLDPPPIPGGNDSLDLLKLQRAQWRGPAERGLAEAQYQLGMSYCCGYGVGRNDELSRHWLCRAAAQGFRKAQLQLGRWYGRYFEKRLLFSTWEYPAYAHFWYSLAAAQGDELAATYRDALERDMTAQEIHRSRYWQRHPQDVTCD